MTYGTLSKCVLTLSEVWVVIWHAEMASAGVNSDYHKSDPFAPAESARSMEERDEKRYHNRYRSLLFGQVVTFLVTPPLHQHASV